MRSALADHPTFRLWLTLLAAEFALLALLTATVASDLMRAGLFVVVGAALVATAAASLRHWPRLIGLEVRVVCAGAAVVLVHALLTMVS